MFEFATLLSIVYKKATMISPYGLEVIMKLLTSSFRRHTFAVAVTVVAATVWRPVLGQDRSAGGTTAAWPGSSSSPAFFSDGRRIAFTFAADTGQPAHVRIANLDGTGERELTSGAETALDPKVSPDGKFVSYISVLIPTVPAAVKPSGPSAPNSGLKCLVVSVDSGEVREVASGTGLVTGPWSLDNRQIAVATRTGRGPSAVISSFIAAIDGTRRLELTSGLSRLETAQWAGDGRLAYAAAVTGGAAIQIADRDGSHAHPLVGGIAIESRPSWSPDSSQVAFFGSDDPAGPVHLYAVRADGKGLRQIVEDARGITGVVFSPDGKKILFADGRNHNTDLYVIDSDGGHERRLTSDPGFDEHQSWSPDGRRIVFMNHTEGSAYGIYLIDANGTNLRRIH